MLVRVRVRVRVRVHLAQVCAELLGSRDVDLASVADVAAQLVEAGLVQVGEGVDRALPVRVRLTVRVRAVRSTRPCERALVRRATIPQ